MSTPARKIEIRKANEALILEAAERVFALAGYKGATTGQIAREAGLPKANVHYYFKTKSELYRRVLAHILEDWMEAALTFDAHHDPEDVLRSYVIAKMEFSRQRPAGSKVWCNEIMSGAPIMEKFLGTTLKTWVDAKVSAIQGWIRDGKIKPVDPKALLYMIWATTQHYADFERQIAILGGGKEMTEKQYRQRSADVVNLVLASVGLHA